LLLNEGDRPLEGNGLCPPDMASIDDRYCVDRYEASLLEVLASGEEVPFSPFQAVEGHVVRAVSEPGVYPQGYISGSQAQEACSRSGKRLCKPAEWRNACMGPQHTTYGYGNVNEPRRCNDHGRSPVVAMYGGDDLGDQAKWNWERMNNSQLNQLPGTLAHAGDHPDCTNEYGVYDMVGNLHEWVADPRGTFQGGYYQDTQLNGEGCTYRTMAHAYWYHDYSTGFRCCADVGQ
jgi:formylglycine-generating enzyme required for sulfatase activity